MSRHSYQLESGDLPGHVIIRIGDETATEKTESDANVNNLTINVGCPGFQGEDKIPSENCQNEIFSFEIGKFTFTSYSAASKMHN